MNYVLAVFTSRSHTMSFYNKLRAKNVPCAIINNPKATKITCGICVKFYITHISVARQVLSSSINGFAGFYKYNENFGRPIVSPL